MQISIASGKGGTGKTTLALMLAAAQSDITLIDCDVEEPNCHLFLNPNWQTPSQKVSVKIPHIDPLACTGCGACSSACLFNALAVSGRTALLFDELCHSCGACQLACQHNAISEKEKEIGVIQSGTAAMYSGIHLISGTLNIGTPSTVPIIKTMKQQIAKLSGDTLLDCPPGTACSMVTAVKQSDYCILVTEPTPFGKHDLKLAANITNLLNIPAGIVINKSDEGDGDQDIEAFCKERQIPLLAKIPHSLSFARQYASGQISDEFKEIASLIWQRIKGCYQ